MAGTYNHGHTKKKNGTGEHKKRTVKTTVKVYFCVASLKRTGLLFGISFAFPTLWSSCAVWWIVISYRDQVIFSFENDAFNVYIMQLWCAQHNGCVSQI